MSTRPEFTLEAIRARSDYNDEYRRERRLPYSDADIRQLLMCCEQDQAEIARLKGDGHTYSQIAGIFHDHIKCMAAEHDNWNYTDAHDRVRAIVLYRVAFHEGWPRDDVENAVRDEFCRARNEHRAAIGELTLESAREMRESRDVKDGGRSHGYGHDYERY